MTSELQQISGDEDMPPALEMALADAKKMKEFAETEGAAGADFDKFKSFNKSVIEGRIEFLQNLINSEEVTDTVPPPIYAKIKEFEGPAIAAIRSAAESKLDAVSKAAFLLIDADGDGKLSKEEVRTFVGKVFDFAVCMAQAGIDIGAQLGNAIGSLAIKFLMEKMFGGAEITNEMVMGMIAEVGEDGPEMLL